MRHLLLITWTQKKNMLVKEFLGITVLAFKIFTLKTLKFSKID